jgi:site-specific recombinase XerC
LRRPSTLQRALRPAETPTRTDALVPQVLHADAEASVRALLREGESANTRRSYASALKYWAAWFELRYTGSLALPVAVPVVLQFVVDHLARLGPAGQLAHDLPPAVDAALLNAGDKARPGALSLATVTHRLTVLSKAHQLHGLANPVRSPAVQELVRRARRAYAARAALSQRADALTKDPLEAMLATCTDGLRGIRDRALLLFAFASGGRRRSEVARATVGNLSAIDADTYIYRLTHTKTDQAGTESNPHADKPIVGLAAQALTLWLKASGIESGALFRRIRRTRAAEPLSARAVWLIVKHRAALAGLQGHYGAHSLRSGFVTEAGRQNVPLGETMALTGHLSVQTVMRYFHTGRVQDSSAARLMQRPDKG